MTNAPIITFRQATNPEWIALASDERVCEMHAFAWRQINAPHTTRSGRTDYRRCLARIEREMERRAVNA